MFQSSIEPCVDTAGAEPFAPRLFTRICDWWWTTMRGVRMAYCDLAPITRECADCHGRVHAIKSCSPDHQAKLCREMFELRKTRYTCISVYVRVFLCIFI